MTISSENEELIKKLKTLVEAADEQSTLLQAAIDQPAVKEEMTETEYDHNE